MKTTFKAAKAALAALNVSLVKTRAGDYRVRLREDVKPFDSDLGYFTDNLDDAIATGRDMRSRQVFDCNFNEIN